MSFSTRNDWQNLPDSLYGDLMMMLGRKTPEYVKKCREVCKSWNVGISQISRHKKDTIMIEVEDMVAMYRDVFDFDYKTNLREIAEASMLAYHELLSSVKWWVLENIDLTSVPSKHLAALASCVTTNIYINNVRPNPICLLDSVKCNKVTIINQSLNSEETQALVRAMESRVMRVLLSINVSVDIETLTQYNGQGRCAYVHCTYDTADRYREEMKRWGERMIMWTVGESLDESYGGNHETFVNVGETYPRVYAERQCYCNCNCVGSGLN